MTKEELMRFIRGNELSEQIETIKGQIDNLSSEEFWECVETIIDVKHKKLEQLQQNSINYDTRRKSKSKSL